MPSLAGALPEDGEGAPAAVRLLLDGISAAATRSAGPRFFHFVTGGVTPAALAADWLVSLVDQNAFSPVSSPLAAELERVALGWLADLFGLPAAHGGVFTSGATTANLVGLAAARHRCGERHGVDVEREGLAAMPQLRVFASGYVHQSVLKALGILGVGRANVRILARGEEGELDLAALDRALAERPGGPAIVVATAGEVNAGRFDPVAGAADVASAHGAWLHVDGAFGLFARVTPAAAPLAAGVDRADSVASDGHKWLNVPYDCGFAFVADPALLAKTFSVGAAYLAGGGAGPSFGQLGPDLSRRARALVAWATLRAYGRGGYRAMVERHLALAQRLARRVDETPELERLAEVPLNVVCFRYRPPGADEQELDRLNQLLGERLLADGRVYAGTTRLGGKVALRPAIVNWRTGEADVDLLVDVVCELAAAL